MRLRSILLFALIVLPLAGCATSVEQERPVIAPPPEPPLIPAVPADVMACFSAPVTTPDAAMDAGTVEKAWKTDRASLVKVNSCLHRIVCQYQDVRKDIGRVSGVTCEQSKPAVAHRSLWSRTK